ncbi:MAG: glycoside hydrolase family 97 N-terminal domain-containing protein [Bacteroidaceae bacterium]|nr:glycoside hydrolase family 97 N-terminal domain-containing protein [Bacteroidaceae bacterium]
MRTRILILALLTCAVCMAQTVSSPDGSYVFTLHATEGRIGYHITFYGECIVTDGELGVEIDNRLFESALGIPNDSCRLWGDNLQLKSYETSEVDTTWTPLYGENASVRDHYRQLTLHLSKGEAANRAADYEFDKRRFYCMDIEVRAYEEGVAMRYMFPEQSNGLFLNITGERTSFTLPEGSTVFHAAWAQDQYRELPLSELREESERPLLLHLPSGTWAALLEAAMVDYARGKFRPVGNNTLQVSLFSGVEVMSPYATPWRVVMAGHRAVDLINHKDLILNLNTDPPLTLPVREGVVTSEKKENNCQLSIINYQFVKPGKVYRCGRLDRDYILRGIRFAEQMKFQFIELDARWYGPEMAMASSALSVSTERDFTIPEVVDSARAHGLGVWLYVNQRALYQQLDSILPLYERWGVSGIKFGFVQVGNQMWSTWLHDAVRQCAEHHLMVDIHDEYRPTGVSRTLPNLLTCEGIGGQEEMPPVYHNLVLPFTRFLCGPADYTPTYYNNRKKGTFAHQLAMPVVYYSPLQFLFWYDDPQLHDGLWPTSDQFGELQFWRDIPTVWDENLALDGAPGEYIIQARRSGKEWFIGVMNNPEARTVSIPTNYLPKGKYEVIIYNDDPTLDTRSKVKSEKIEIQSGNVITLQLLPSGGAALHIKPISK